MQAREVNLTKRVQTAKGLRYCRALWAPNGRLKPNAVLVDGKEESHPEGCYYIEWREDGKRIRLSIGNDPWKLPSNASARKPSWLLDGPGSRSQIRTAGSPCVRQWTGTSRRPS